MIFLLLIVRQALYASVNLIDKYLVGKKDAESHEECESSRPGALLAISAVFSFLLAVVLGICVILFNINIGSMELIALIANGSIYTIALWMYLAAMKQQDSASVVAWFQFIPVWGLIGGFIILGELPLRIELVAILLLTIGGMIVSHQKGKVNVKVMVLMILASLLLATNDVVFAHYGRQISTIAALFATAIGKAFWGLMFLLIPRDRKGFVKGFKGNFFLQSTAGTACGIADNLTNIALYFAPVAVVQAMGCSQPFFVLAGALFMTKRNPEILKEELGQGNLKWKVTGIILMCAGGVILAFTRS